MTPQEALKRLHFYDILCLQNVASGKGKLNTESLRDLENLGLIVNIDGRWLTTTLCSYTLKAHSTIGRK